MPETRKGFGDVFSPTKPPASDKSQLLKPRVRRETGPALRVAEDPAPSPSLEVAAVVAVEPAAISESVSGRIDSKGVYLPPGLLKLVKSRIHAHKMDDEDKTYTDLLIDAFESIDFDDVTKHFRPELNISSSGIHRRVRRKRGTAGIQIQLRLDKGQERWIDAKAKETGAPSRSAFVSYVFELFLGPS
ncbi:hypothetical protein [Arthrobacter sp. Leaf337]|uniref:hypothetical protein n=1 Tax=Arthrobacter sp. Leaf337 TaxID=1736342 RepID=UPI000B0A1332|nr:hypothetical protein [Arthrobacter sp. Leaf337]